MEEYRTSERLDSSQQIVKCRKDWFYCIESGRKMHENTSLHLMVIGIKCKKRKKKNTKQGLGLRKFINSKKIRWVEEFLRN